MRACAATITHPQKTRVLTTSEKYWTVVMGLKMLGVGGSADRYSYIILSLLPPVLIIIFLQRLFIQGLFQSK